jgi:hypothetical protein
MAGWVPAAAAAALGAPRIAEAAQGDVALERSVFLRCVGEEFVFEKSALEQCHATLREVVALPAHGAKSRGEGNFKLLFDVPSGLVQESYRVSHSRMGRFVLFVSPNDSQGNVVEAIFNRL